MATSRLFQAADALALTGLTRSQLREWTGRGRRALILPDVEPEGPGRHALFAWQTLLVLRLLLVLHTDLAAEVGAWAVAAKVLREQLDRISFPSLWRLSAFFPSRQSAQLVEGPGDVNSVGVILPLEPHLTVLATKLSQRRPDQLSLWPAMVVSR
jgi:hypothetical protein